MGREHEERHRHREHRHRSHKEHKSSRRKRDHDSDDERASKRRHRSRRDENGSTEDSTRQMSPVEAVPGPEAISKADMEEQQRLMEEQTQARRERVAAWRDARKAEQTLSDGGAEKAAEVEVEAGAIATGADSGAAAVEEDEGWSDDEVDTAKMRALAKERARTEMTGDMTGDMVDLPDGEPMQVTPAATTPPLLSATRINSHERNRLAAEQPEPPAAKAEENDEDDEEDPLDAFMAGVQEEVKVINKRDAHRLRQDTMRRGEIMVQNDDAMEYSSEEETERLPYQEKDINAPGYWSGFMPKQRKELGSVDHNSVAYEPFRKDFYIEVPEIAALSQQDAAQLRFELENISVRGKDVPKPVKTWTQCGVNMKMLEAIKKAQYAHPTPIQAQAIPTIMSGRDMLGIAKTGSGKTLAFLLPLFRHLLDQRPLESGEGPVGLIITPTRELALQIVAEAQRFAKPLGVRVACVYGGSSISEQIADLKRGAEIIVCTPGRMIDMLTSNSGKVTNLRRTTYVTLDEADRMFDMGFEPQVMKILSNVRPNRQTVMFSATFPRPMEALARKILKKPVEITVGGRSVVSDTVSQNVVVIEEDDKFPKLLELLGHYQQTGQVLVFVEKQTKCDMLLKDLMSMAYPCLPLHGCIDQQDRDSNIHDFKMGNCPLLVATSVAARGLDVKSLNLVVNYDIPSHYEDYVHRVGRTGRAGRKGTAYTFITPEQGRFGQDLIKALELSGNKPPEALTQLWATYKSERKKSGGGAKGSGFGGRGFKFDEGEEEKKQKARKAQMQGMGMPGEEEEDIEEDIFNTEDAVDAEVEAELEALLGLGKAKAKAKSEAKIEPTPAAALSTAAPVAGATEGALAAATAAAALISSQTLMTSASSFNNNPNSADAKLAAAQRIAQSLAKNLGPSAPEGANVATETMARARELEEKYGLKKPDEPDEPVGRFEEELEINDFPQQARWRVTRKEHVAELSDFSGCAITVRGSFFPKGKNPKEGERKLYLFLESTTEGNVVKAKAEIIRILKEELKRNKTEFTASRQVPGRYNPLSLTFR